jgi:hypothetical protein
MDVTGIDVRSIDRALTIKDAGARLNASLSNTRSISPRGRRRHSTVKSGKESIDAPTRNVVLATRDLPPNTDRETSRRRSALSRRSRLHWP